MSLLSREIETFDFYRGSRHWRYTDVDRLVIVEAQEYTPVRGLKRGRIVQSAEVNKNTLDITVPANVPLMELFRPYPPLDRVHLNVKRIRVSDGLVRQAWMGVVADVDDDGVSPATLKCQNLAAAMASRVLRRTWQVPCPLVLYSAGTGQCNANADDFKVPAVLSDSTGLVIKSGAFATQGDHYFSGGFIRWEDAGAQEFAYIVFQVGDTVTLLAPTDLPAGAEVDAFPGCDHTLATCASKFDNAENYGGQHTLPVDNPFENPVF